MKLRVEYDRVIRKVGNQLIRDYQLNGHAMSGINGPYDDPETEIRNLCHLSIIVAIEILLFKKTDFTLLIDQMGRQILSFGQGGIYKLREKEGKDCCNGVIGHAWIIEALVYIYKVTKEQDYIFGAAEIAYAHNFENRIGLWRTPDIVRAGEVDYTMNHQLCFAASLAELNVYLNDKTIAYMLGRFMEELDKNIGIHRNGRVCHGVIRRIDRKGTVKVILKNNIDRCFELAGLRSMKYKEEGYHIFNLNAMARIYKCNKKYRFFRSRKFLQSVGYFNSGKCRQGLYDARIDKDRSLEHHITILSEKALNVYGYPYNVPGFEAFYISSIWKGEIKKSEASACLKDQFAYTYDYAKAAFGQRCHDKKVINYRIYEYYRGLEAFYA